MSKQTVYTLSIELAKQAERIAHLETVLAQLVRAPGRALPNVDPKRHAAMAAAKAEALRTGRCVTVQL